MVSFPLGNEQRKDETMPLTPRVTIVPAQRQAYTQTFSTATRTHSNPTAAALTVAAGAGTNNGTIETITGDASVTAAVQELADQINKLVADLANTKQVLNNVIDDLQAMGTMQ